MPSKDPDRARSWFINAVNRFIEGARLERDRVIRTAAEAPRLLEGTPHEVVNLTGIPDNDLDYYVYELGRLQDAARPQASTALRSAQHLRDIGAPRRCRFEDDERSPRALDRRVHARRLYKAVPQIDREAADKIAGLIFGDGGDARS